MKEMLVSLDALPEPKLIPHELIENGEVCAIGSVGKSRGTDMSKLNPYHPEGLAKEFGIAPALVKEIEFENDEAFCTRHYSDPQETPEARFIRVRKWVASQIRSEAA